MLSETYMLHIKEPGTHSIALTNVLSQILYCCVESEHGKCRTLEMRMALPSRQAFDATI